MKNLISQNGARPGMAGLFSVKRITVLEEGHGRSNARADAMARLSVAINTPPEVA